MGMLIHIYRIWYMVLYQLSPISTITIPRGDSVLEHNPILYQMYDTIHCTLLRYVETNCDKFMSVYQHYRVVSRYVLQHRSWGQG